MKNVLIVEDEFTIALDIEKRLKKMGFNSIGTALSYNEAIAILVENPNVDIAILDINLGTEKSGIDLGVIITEKFKIPIIFLTAYSDSKTFSKAEEAKPMGYITKPFNDDSIFKAITIALNRFNKNDSDKKVNKKSEFLFIKEKRKLVKIKIADILWLKAIDNYTMLYAEDKSWLVNQFLKDVLIKLEEDKFIRIHKSFAVAIDKITSIEANTLYINKIHLSIGRKYKILLMEKLSSF